MRPHLQGHLLVLLVLPGLIAGTLGRPAEAARRRFFNTVNATSAAFLYQSQFEAYVDSMAACGIGSLRVAGQWRLKCHQCAPDTMDVNTNPAPGVYDFGFYFDRLDYAVFTRGMKLMVCFNLGGKLPSDPLAGGSQPVWPEFLGDADAMMYRASPGVDLTYSFNLIRTPRIARPSTRASMLAFAGEVVRQFLARYGDAVLGFSFTLAHFGEAEYPLAGYPYFCDTSPDAAAAFRPWLAGHYGTPQAVAAAWGHSPPFTSFDQIQILDGQGSPPIGQAPAAYLDFMAYREDALGSFLHEVRDTVHANGGQVMAQFGSVWDVLSTTRGTVGFGRQVEGFDLVVVDDAPGYDHTFSMDYTRTNTPGVPFGNEADAPCQMGCTTGNTSQCCYPWPGNPYWSESLAKTQFDAYFEQSYPRGATWMDLANWDNFYDDGAFAIYAAQVANAVAMASQPVTTVVAADTQHVSQRDWYVHHHESAFVNGLVATHAALGGQSTPIAVALAYDLEPPVLVDVPPDPASPALSLAIAGRNPARGETVVRFTLARRERASLTLLDVAGRMVRALAAGEFGPGDHTVPVDGRDLPSGVYLVRLETPSGRLALRLELIR